DGVEEMANEGNPRRHTKVDLAFAQPQREMPAPRGRQKEQPVQSSRHDNPTRPRTSKGLNERTRMQAMHQKYDRRNGHDRARYPEPKQRFVDGVHLGSLE